MNTPWNSPPKRGAIRGVGVVYTGELSRRPETSRMVVGHRVPGGSRLETSDNVTRREPQGHRDLTENRADTDKGVRRLVSCESDTVLCPG